MVNCMLSLSIVCCVCSFPVCPYESKPDWSEKRAIRLDSFRYSMYYHFPSPPLSVGVVVALCKSRKVLSTKDPRQKTRES